jgi:hypothetical protein
MGMVVFHAVLMGVGMAVGMAVSVVIMGVIVGVLVGVVVGMIVVMALLGLFTLELLEAGLPFGTAAAIGAHGGLLS